MKLAAKEKKMAELLEERSVYWDKFYAGRASAEKITPPSQFGAFVAQEASFLSHILDVGCGNGRDSLFFSRHGYQVVGFDMSGSAVAAATASAQRQGLTGIRFIEGDVAGPSLPELISELGENPLCVYARFFLHAISEEEQARFIAALGAELKADDMVAVEYRTEEDAKLEKVADSHFRRYQRSADVNESFDRAGFELTYKAEGFGYAKFKSEDAYVARGVFRKR